MRLAKRSVCLRHSCQPFDGSGTSYAVPPDDEVRQEVETHLALIEDEERARGLSDQDARHSADRDLEIHSRTGEQAVDAVIAVWFDTLWQDVTFAVRQILKDRASPPSSSLVALASASTPLCSAWWIGSCSSRSLGRPERLVRLNETFEPGNIRRAGVSYPDLATGGRLRPHWGRSVR